MTIHINSISLPLEPSVAETLLEQAFDEAITTMRSFHRPDPVEIKQIEALSKRIDPAEVFCDEELTREILQVLESVNRLVAADTD